MIEILLTNIGLPRILEFVAALAATFSYIFIKESKSKTFKYLLIFLWTTVIFEFIGSYARLVEPYCFEDIEFFKKYPLLIKNYWVFNIYSIIAYNFYAWYLLEQVEIKRHRLVSLYMIIVFNLLTVLNFLLTDIFFKGYSQLTILIGLILIVIVLCTYYYEILKSDRILNISYKLPFYISVGVLLYFISVTPLMLSSQYINKEEIVFTTYYRLILSYANYFLYGIIIFGIVKCYWFNKSQNKKFSLSPTLL
ncbi:hypothetical protein [uncultured Dokdonia sp.]|uniref:hypothetical protein n=1 Tax=uncultured Dokdonia sp. TaxID=575653 RepID=UPI00261609C8|nr:hypothetical protein [uncultured Dokdonia sp.]